MSRPRGGYIGFNRVPAASAINSAASGVWTLREAEALKRAGTWPLDAPGGVGTGLQLWLDASDSATLFDATSGGSAVAADGGVARWEDKSGNARHMTQGTAANRPVRKTATQNGLDILRFDGSNDILELTYNLSSIAAASLIVVAKYADTIGHEIVAAFGTQTSFGGLSVEKQRSGGANFGVVAGSNLAASESSVSLSAANTNINAFAAIYGSGTITGYINNVSAGSTSFAGPLNSQTGFRVGGYFDILYAQADVCEVVYYNKALSSDERTSLQGYLANKWGIT